MTSSAGTALACVLDSGEHWEQRVLNLVRSVRWYGGCLADAPFVARAVSEPSAAFRRTLDGLDARVELVTPTWPDRPFMNKTLALASSADDWRVILLDCDTVVVGDLSALIGDNNQLIAKPVDVDPFTRQEWLALETSSGWDLGRDRLRTTCTGRTTATYLNTGVLSVGPEIRSELQTNWVRAFPALDAAVRSIRPERAFYGEQLGFGAAVVATNQARLVAAPAELNWPAHLEVDPAALSLDGVPKIIHYHFMCRGSRVVAPLAPASVQRRLDALAAAQDGDIEQPWGRDPWSGEEIRAATATKRRLAAG